MFKYFSLLVALAGIGLSVSLVQRQKIVPPVPPPLTEPSAAPYAQSIGARGLVESINENVRIAPSVAGLVSVVPIKVGDEVKSGDLLMQQDTRDADAQVAVQAANLASIQASILEAEVALADRQDQFNRIEQLGENRVVSVDEKQRTVFALRATSIVAFAFVIIVTTLARMWLPGDWKTYSPSGVEMMTFVGTIGLFLALFMLFLKFLPCINIAEVKWTLPQSDPHHDDKEHHPDHGIASEAAYQKELVASK